MLQLHVIASGSKGNASIVEDTQTHTGILIDCGVSKSALFSGCERVGFAPESITAVFVTHEHTDHTKGIGVALRGLDKLGTTPSIYIDQKVLNASKLSKDLQNRDVRTIAMGEEIRIANMGVIPFATSHDATASCGFRVQLANDALGFMTDTGCVTQQAHKLLQDVRILAIEANHDLQMLENGPYPYALKRRVASDKGHLSNEQSAKELELLLHNGLESVVAMHVSENNNEYQLALASLESSLIKHQHPAKAFCGFQARPITVS